MSIFDKFPDILIHFSKLLGIPLYSESNIKMGTLSDVFVDYAEVYPVALAIQFVKNKQFFYVNWDDVEQFTYKKIIIRNSIDIGRSRTFPKVNKKPKSYSVLSEQFTGETTEYPAIGKVILDRQIVDTSGKKVVRVNDIQLIKTGKNLRVTHAEIGLRSMIRRLGYEKFVDGVFSIFAPNSKYLYRDTQINWKYVHAIPDKSVSKNLKINLYNDQITKLHPADLADILEELDTVSRDQLFSDLDPKLAAETLAEVEDEYQVNLVKNKPAEEVAEIIGNMDTDDAVDILDDFDIEKAEEIIANIEDTDVQDDITELLEYKEDTAGGLMSTEVFEVSKTFKKSDVISLIQEKDEDLETIYDLFIIDEKFKLQGSCTLRSLLIQKSDVMLSEIMVEKDIKSLCPETHWKEVASYMSKYNLINVPIIDNENELLGIVSVDDLLPWLLNEK
ncbi:MAG: magnesium transporter [Bacteriovoracaceae bacterium]|jgi:magnesium transporter|nr:magnesium transporter [Bacteriovoracaceae bacterium]